MGSAEPADQIGATKTPVFIGIDVACANGKRLPMCFARTANGQLEPLEIPRAIAQKIPRGPGNGEVRAANPFVESTNGVLSAINAICAEMGWRVARIAVDAPSAPGHAAQRRCEADLVEAGLSVFKTPSHTEWPAVIAKCRAFLDGGGMLAHMPYANMVWMLYGFRLFAALRGAGFETIEVYPFAIVRALMPAHPHKSTTEGYGLQLNAIAARTGWTADELELRLRDTGTGSRHDRLDAFMAAWVASLPREERRVYGDPHDQNDAIWVPVT